MPQFAVFFADGAGFRIEAVQAMDAAHAQDIARAQHPTGRLSAVPALVISQNPTFTFTGAWGSGQTHYGCPGRAMKLEKQGNEADTSTNYIIFTSQIKIDSFTWISSRAN